jgi:hypothetical protein
MRLKLTDEIVAEILRSTAAAVLAKVRVHKSTVNYVRAGTA